MADKCITIPSLVFLALGSPPTAVRMYTIPSLFAHQLAVQYVAGTFSFEEPEPAEAGSRVDRRLTG